ncbi:MAG: DUF488 family protein [Thermodesulfovibrionales bacterium]
MNRTLYTIGHSNMDIDNFVQLLVSANIEVLVDVRSSPYSKYASQFNKGQLIKVIKANGIKYVYLGDLLGGKPSDKSCYINNEPNYDLIRKKEFYQRGLDRLMNGIAQYHVAILCSEEDPLKCHRRNLIAKDMHVRGVKVLHIRNNGVIEKDDFLIEDEKVLQESLF